MNHLDAVKNHFGIKVEDDDISARHFSTVGGLTDFVQEKLDP